mmetsp:Transcript_10817/g.46052  ORF Transcript_10817/g.46052 Transcript_10817/m.46052 type:complete len:315 (+) Transcript_10817:887-1831(+)
MTHHTDAHPVSHHQTGRGVHQGNRRAAVHRGGAAKPVVVQPVPRGVLRNLRRAELLLAHRRRAVDPPRLRADGLLPERRAPARDGAAAQAAAARRAPEPAVDGARRRARLRHRTRPPLERAAQRVRRGRDAHERGVLRERSRHAVVGGLARAPAVQSLFRRRVDDGGDGHARDAALRQQHVRAVLDGPRLVPERDGLGAPRHAALLVRRASRARQRALRAAAVPGLGALQAGRPAGVGRRRRRGRARGRVRARRRVVVVVIRASALVGGHVLWKCTRPKSSKTRKRKFSRVCEFPGAETRGDGARPSRDDRGPR